MSFSFDRMPNRSSSLPFLVAPFLSSSPRAMEAPRQQRGPWKGAVTLFSFRSSSGAMMLSGFFVFALLLLRQRRREEMKKCDALLLSLTSSFFCLLVSLPSRSRSLARPLSSATERTDEPCRPSTSTRWSEVRRERKLLRLLDFRRQTFQDGFFVSRSHPSLSPPLSRSPLSATSNHPTEKLQAFLVNYLDPETDQLKYLIQLVRSRENSGRERVDVAEIF